jgi:TPR repeat protein
MYYFNGKGVKQDYAQAFGWWHKAAVQGFAAAQFNLGALYDGGQGVQQSHVEAAKWYRKAADRGHGGAQLNLSVSYFNGKGVPKNEKLAYFWCLVSCAQADQHAARNRDIIETKLSPAQRAEVQAAARAWKPN